MLVVFFCVMMKILEFSSVNIAEDNNCNNVINNRNRNNNRNRTNTRRRRHGRGFQPNVHHRGMTEEISTARTAVANSPGSDCNSNHTSKVVLPAERNSETTASYISNASSQDVDFIQDNSDYQWFLDYGYRDGSSATHHSLHQHASVLSSLTASYGCDDLSYYDDMAKNLDANLAEVDMEDFRTEDIHSILTTLPAMCCGDIQSERQGEMFASVSGSMMAKFDFDSSISPHTSSQGGESAGSTDTMSICKSELLFSPVKECPLPSTNFSVDSLDCDLLTEHDIMLTCQANKDNYTIAFEGSMTLYSEDSDYHEAGESEATTSESNNWPSARLVRPSSAKARGGSHALDTSMARSDSVFTTWSKLKKRSSEVQLTRHPSGNNNTTYSEGTGIPNFQPVDATALKSQSMPNLSRQQRRCLLASMSSKLSNAMSSSMESEPRIRVGGCVKLFDVQNHHNSNCLLSVHSETNSSMDGASVCSGGGNGASSRKQPNFSLVKLFMKQKSVSNEGMCYAMDQSSASECWPPSNNSQSEGESDSYNQDSMRQRFYQMNNNVVHSREQENSACGCLNDYRCEFHDNGNNSTENVNDIKTTVTNPVIEGTNNWIRADDIPTECFEDSLVEPCRKEDSYIHKHHELIEEEEEEEDEEHESEQSESVEQLSESVSKIEESNVDLEANSYISDQQEEQCSYSSQNNKPKFSNSITKKLTMFNVNNNNSIERDDLQVLGRLKGQNQGTQTKKLGSFSSSGGSISNCSSSEETEHPRLKVGSPGTIATTKNTSTQVPVHLMHRSIQTSEYADVKLLKSHPFKLLETKSGASLVKIILPNLPEKGKTDDDSKRPVYVFYPNYTLPDLQFLREKQKELDVTKVFLMPQKFTPPNFSEPNQTNRDSADGASKPAPRTGKTRRPFSCSDVETLRKKGFSHIRDWDSLTFLLPQECRQILAEVPEIVHYMKGKDEIPRPLFCVSPPVSTCKGLRTTSCNCSSLESKPIHSTCNLGTNVSVSSSTATQPSSGYRGSSTILSDSSSNHNATNCNPLFVYHYDSTSSESTVMMKQQKPAPFVPKRSLSHPEEAKRSVPMKQDISTPPRPPLPRGILRKSLEGNNGSRINNYNCKAHKNSANSKRYSMFELGSGMDVCKESKRKSLHDADLLAYARRGVASCKVAEEAKSTVQSEKDVDELEDEEYDDEGVDAGTDSSLEEGLQGFQMRPPTPPIPRTPDEEGVYVNDQNEVLQLEEFLQMSGLSIIHSGDSPKEWNETDMTKLKQKVSKFLTNKTRDGTEHSGGCDCCSTLKPTGVKKTVSFAAQVHETSTPPNSPSLSANADTHKSYSCKVVNAPLKDLPIREEGESSPDEFSSPASVRKKISVSPSENSSEPHSPTDLSHKRALMTAVADAVEQIICHFAAAEGQAHCVVLGDSSQTPACAQLALTKLCPAMYAILSDGLRPTLDTAFGSIQNSVWQVVEASAQQGPITKALNDLVLRLNGEDVLTEGLMKFNAFVFGLLNVHSLDAWAGYLRTRESVLRKHYMPDGLLLMSNTAGASVRALVDQLILTLQPLALLPFKLDLLFEVRQLHHSLRRMSSLVQPEVPHQSAGSSSSSSSGASSSSPIGGKPWTLMKLVRSIQNSITQSGDEETHGGWHHRKPQADVLMTRAEEQTHHPNCSAGNTDSPPLPDLLDSSCANKQCNGAEKTRPRSCIDHTAQGTGGFSLVTDIASTVKKRWSGIHLGSKLFQAFDRLGTEDTEEEYSDSLENKPRKRHTSTSSNNSTSDDYPENITREESPLPAASAPEKADPQAGKCNETSGENRSAVGTGGGKFKRLQMKWEMLSGKESNSNETSPTGNSLSPNQASDCTSGSTPTSRSKIPRLVTSPVRNSDITVTSPQQTQIKKTAMSPPVSTSQLRKPSNFSSKLKVSPAATAKESVEGKVQKTTSVNVSPAVKNHPSAVTRCSRVDQLHGTDQGSGLKRPSSLPYKPSISAQGNKRGQLAVKPETQRRAASTSLNRQRNDGSQARQRYVRTLCHRLPSESGHLTFNDGELLRLVLDVDDKWLLCCRGDQKGLVPKQAVIAVQDNLSRF